MRMVTLVYGPPCAGKSTYVEQHAHLGDVVLDLDVIAREIGSRQQWGHAPHIVRQANRLWREQAMAIGRAEDIRAWVIRGAPGARERANVARLIRATDVTLLLPDEPTLLARAHRRPRVQHTLGAIADWRRVHSSGGGLSQPRAVAAQRVDLHNDWGERKRRAAVVRQHRQLYGDWCPGYGVAPHPDPDLTADHVVPVGAGGDPHGPLAVLCRSCNSRKREGRSQVVRESYNSSRSW
jgi:hypothetical protein